MTFATIRAFVMEKATAAWQSFTMWYGGMIVALPEVLNYVQTNFHDVSAYIPQALQAPVLHWIGLGVILCRLRSLGKPKA